MLYNINFFSNPFDIKQKTDGNDFKFLNFQELLLFGHVYACEFSANTQMNNSLNKIPYINFFMVMDYKTPDAF